MTLTLHPPRNCNCCGAVCCWAHPVQVKPLLGPVEVSTDTTESPEKLPQEVAVSTVPAMEAFT